MDATTEPSGGETGVGVWRRSAAEAESIGWPWEIGKRQGQRPCIPEAQEAARGAGRGAAARETGDVERVGRPWPTASETPATARAATAGAPAPVAHRVRATATLLLSCATNWAAAACHSPPAAPIPPEPHAHTIWGWWWVWGSWEKGEASFGGNKRWS